EQRYNIHVPKRKESQHRFYDGDDLKHLLQIAYLYSNGIKISKIAALDNEDVITLALKNYSDNNDYSFYIKELVEASIDFDEDKFTRIYEQALLKLDVEKTIEHVIYPYLDKIGVLWLTDRVIPAQEHFSSNLIRQKLIVAIDSLGKKEIQRKYHFALFTPQNEHHELPLLFVQYNLKKHGFKTSYFGANIPVRTISAYAKEQHLTHVYFHLITNLTSKELNEYVNEIARQFAGQSIIMSGNQQRYIHQPPSNLRVVSSLHNLHELIESLP
ncbi:MAG: helix-turn-helix-type transcriptional regulator, partial [Segetibacter sp.]|nr:helix-turn-helix-type transcriptional regulator [Segetibacter sp.]